MTEALKDSWRRSPAVIVSTAAVPQSGHTAGSGSRTSMAKRLTTLPPPSPDAPETTPQARSAQRRGQRAHAPLPRIAADDGPTALVRHLELVGHQPMQPQ